MEYFGIKFTRVTGYGFYYFFNVPPHLSLTLTLYYFNSKLFDFLLFFKSIEPSDIAHCISKPSLFPSHLLRYSSHSELYFHFLFSKCCFCLLFPPFIILVFLKSVQSNLSSTAGYSLFTTCLYSFLALQLIVSVSGTSDKEELNIAKLSETFSTSTKLYVLNPVSWTVIH